MGTVGFQDTNPALAKSPANNELGTSMVVRTIAVFHTHASHVAAWSCSEGIVRTIADMGYAVIPCGNPAVTFTPIDVLKKADLILLSSPEWYVEHLLRIYGSAWNDLPARKVAWYVESSERDDRSFAFEHISTFADRHYFPAAQDAAKFAGEWLPFGVDTKMFYPRAVSRRYIAAFLGNVYPKRAEYLARLEFPLARMAPVVHDDIIRSFEMLADAYCSTRIFVNLPAYSRLLVTKVTEVMACRTMLVTPQIDHPSSLANMSQFEDGKHLVYYDPNRPKDIGDIIRHYAAHPAECEEIAQAGWTETVRGHSLRSRLDKIISDSRFSRVTQGKLKFSRAWTGSVGAAVPAVTEFYYVLSFHESFLCIDKDQMRLCHEKTGGFRPKILMEFTGSEAHFHYIDSASAISRRFTVINPAGEISERPEFLRKSVVLEKVRDGVFAFRLGDNYLSADDDGVVRNDRNCCLDWEHYRLIKAEARPR